MPNVLRLVIINEYFWSQCVLMCKRDVSKINILIWQTGHVNEVEENNK